MILANNTILFGKTPLKVQNDHIFQKVGGLWTLCSPGCAYRNQAEICNGNSAMERRAQMQSCVNQTELTSELNLQCDYVALVERRFCPKNN